MNDSVTYEGHEIKMITQEESIRMRPGMYIGKPSLYGLQCLICGLGMAITPKGERRAFNIDFFAFDKWINEKIKSKTRSNSFGKALHQCNDDDKEAFYLWYEWYNEFSASHSKSE